jgi:hypothetical protein
LDPPTDSAINPTANCTVAAPTSIIFDPFRDVATYANLREGLRACMAARLRPARCVR